MKLSQKIKTSISFSIPITLNSLLTSIILILHVENVLGVDNETIITDLLVYTLVIFILLISYYFIESSIIGYKINLRSLLSITIFYFAVNLILLINVLLDRYNLINSLSVFLILISRILTLLYLEIPWKATLESLWRNRLRFMLIILIPYSISVIFLFIIHQQPGINQLIWENSDSVVYKNLSNSLAVLSPGKSVFSLGLPLLMTPMNLLMGTFPHLNNLYYDNLLNNVHFYLFGFIVTPLGILMVIKAALANLVTTHRKYLKLYSVIVIIAILIMISYFAILPNNYELLTIDDTKRMWLRVLGFVPAVEPLINLGSAIFIYILAYWNKKKFNPYLIGLIGGVFLLVKEPNFIIWGLFLLFVVLQSRKILWAIKAFFVSMLTYSLQLIYNLSLYGDPLEAGRAGQLEKVQFKYVDYVKNIYGIEPMGEQGVSLFSLSYLEHNLENILTFYALPVLLLIIFALILYRVPSLNKKIITFCYVNILLFVPFYAAGIRLGATTRYFSALLPYIIYLTSLVILCGINWLKTTRSKASR